MRNLERFVYQHCLKQSYLTGSDEVVLVILEGIRYNKMNAKS